MTNATLKYLCQCKFYTIANKKHMTTWTNRNRSRLRLRWRWGTHLWQIALCNVDTRRVKRRSAERWPLRVPRLFQQLVCLFFVCLWQAHALALFVDHHFFNFRLCFVIEICDWPTRVNLANTDLRFADQRCLPPPLLYLLQVYLTQAAHTLLYVTFNAVLSRLKLTIIADILTKFYHCRQQTCTNICIRSRSNTKTPLGDSR